MSKRVILHLTDQQFRVWSYLLKRRYNVTGTGLQKLLLAAIQEVIQVEALKLQNEQQEGVHTDELKQ